MGESSNEIFIVLAFWSVLSALHTGNCLRTQASFRSLWWEGGLTLSGKFLSQRVTYLRFVVMVILSAYITSMVFGQISFYPGKRICIVLVCAQMLLDFFLSTREEPLVIPSATIHSEPDNQNSWL